MHACTQAHATHKHFSIQRGGCRESLPFGLWTSANTWSFAYHKNIPDNLSVAHCLMRQNNTKIRAQKLCASARVSVWVCERVCVFIWDFYLLLINERPHAWWMWQFTLHLEIHNMWIIEANTENTISEMVLPYPFTIMILWQAHIQINGKLDDKILISKM